MTIPFDSEQTDLYLPLLINGGKTIISKAEKFDSYRMSTSVECYVLEEGIQPQKIRFNFKRRKLAGLQFAASDEKIFFVGVYSKSTNRDNVSGVLQAGYNLKNERFSDAREFVFPEFRVRELRKALASSGRKGNLLNYLAVLPGTTDENAPVFATLIPAQNSTSIDFDHTPWQRIRFFNERAAEIAATGFAEQLLFGWQRGEFGEAKLTTSGSESMRQADAQFLCYNLSPAFRRRINRHDNLMFISSRLEDFKWLQFNDCAESRYNFSQYLVLETGFGALYYRPAAAAPPQLFMSVIDKTGNIIERRIATDPDKFILADRAVLYRDGSLVCFYEDKRAGETGLWKLKVE